MDHDFTLGNKKKKDDENHEYHKTLGYILVKTKIKLKKF